MKCVDCGCDLIYNAKEWSGLNQNLIIKGRCKACVILRGKD